MSRIDRVMLEKQIPERYVSFYKLPESWITNTSQPPIKDKQNTLDVEQGAQAGTI